MALMITDECINREVCPVDCIPANPDHPESHEALLLKYQGLMAAKSAKAA